MLVATQLTKIVVWSVVCAFFLDKVPPLNSGCRRAIPVPCSATLMHYYFAQAVGAQLLGLSERFRSGKVEASRAVNTMRVATLQLAANTTRVAQCALLR